MSRECTAKACVFVAALLLGAIAPASEGDRLRDAALAQPDDRPCRLVYADWLEENEYGHPLSLARAELIRIDDRLQILPAASPDRAALEAQRRALLTEHGSALAPGVTLPLERMHFVAGVPRGVTATVAEITANRKALAALGISTIRLLPETPIAWFYTTQEFLRDPANAPLLARVRHLDLSKILPDPRPFPFSWPNPVPQLETLEVPVGMLLPTSINDLKQCLTRFRALRLLRVHGNPDSEGREDLRIILGITGARLEIVR